MLTITELREGDIVDIAKAFAALNKSEQQYRRYFAEQQERARLVLVARSDAAIAGYVTVVWQSDYPPFREAGIPEIQDFNVLPDFRRQRIGSQLMDKAERLIAARSRVCGIGVGLHHDYGAAQRLYALRGYVPDARGITSHGRRVNWGDEAKIDDDLVLWLTKPLS
ncbi:MAG TPA: GNAT family N-acetyltransferase [Rhizomicrobium sp.]|jgi:GNAT superfamily N-acetyltransferase